MTKMAYKVLLTKFKTLKTIKDKKAALEQASRNTTSAYAYALLSELVTLSREKDVLGRHTHAIVVMKDVLRRNLRYALLTQEEVEVVFGTAKIGLWSVSVAEAVELCNKLPNLNCSIDVSHSQNTSGYPTVNYGVRGNLELALQAGVINDPLNNKLFKQLTANVPSFDELAKPLLQNLAHLEVLKELNK